MMPCVVASASVLVAELLSLAFAPEGADGGGELDATLTKVLPDIEGAFSSVLMDAEHLVGVRDPNGSRPLCLGRLDDGWVLASETPALDVVGARFVRELQPGEMVVIDRSGLRSVKAFSQEQVDPKLCIFELVYFGRSDRQHYG